MPNKRRIALLSAGLGVASSIPIPAVLGGLSNASVGPQPWATLMGGYILAAGLLEPVVWHLLPWSDLFPRGGAPGAFALMAVCVLLFWGTLLSIAWFAYLRMSQSP
jgi:hypothetical protein